MAQDKDVSIFFEVVCCYHPTDYDPIGKDGLYVKSVRQVRPPEQRNGADAPKHSGAAKTPEYGATSNCVVCGRRIVFGSERVWLHCEPQDHGFARPNDVIVNPPPS